MAPVVPETTAPSGRHDEQEQQLKKPVVIYAPPGMIGHLVSAVELGKLFAEHGLKVVIVLGGQADDDKAAAASAAAGDAAASFLEGATAGHPELSVHRLPQVARARHVPADDRVAHIFELARASNLDLRDFLRATSPAALLLDFFCGSAVDVGAELGVPTYFFFTTCVAGLALLLYLPVIRGQTTTTTSMRDLGGGLVHVPGLPPVPADHLAAGLVNRDSLANRHFLALPQQLCSSQGIIVNSFRSLEPRAADAIAAGLCTLPGRRAPPLHCVGPLIKPEEIAANRHECLAWLDAQHRGSVVFLCFGSLGRFSMEQTRHVARGLEMSGQRFLWVVRRPPGDGDTDGKQQQQQPDPDLDALLPDGFLARTKDRGLVVKSWAPQREVLAHGAVGGFVTHCGWNSVLEAVVGGVPMLAWPMYAEQRMNKVFLVEEMKLAVAVEGYDKEMVKDEEVAAKVRWLMESDGGAELRQRTREAMRQAKEALSDGGESKIAVLELARKWGKILA